MNYLLIIDTRKQQMALHVCNHFGTYNIDRQTISIV